MSAKAFFVLSAIVVALFLFSEKEISKTTFKLYPRSITEKDWYMGSLKENKFIILDKNSVEHPTVREKTPTLILLNAYMRSGSTFVGHLLGKDQMCSHRMLSCSNADNVTIAYDRLDEIYNCDRSIAIHMNELRIQRAGPGLNIFTKCKRQGGGEDDVCNHILSLICKETQYRVTKVLRLTVDTLEQLLKRHPNLKVVHLFRDPRAVMSSRIHTAWYPVNHDIHAIKMDSGSLCDKMLHDYTSGLALADKYPERLTMVLYEHLLDDLMANTKRLFQTFLNIPFTKYDHDTIVSMTGSATPVDLTGNQSLKQDTGSQKVTGSQVIFWWRSSLKWTRVRAIDKNCQHVCHKLGYTVFHSEKQMQNLTNAGLSTAAIEGISSVRVIFHFVDGKI